MNNYDLSPFVAIITSDGTIFQYANGRKGQAVGIDNQKAQEMECDFAAQATDMQEVIDKLYQELVDAGLRTRPKTEIDIANEQLELTRQQAQQQAEINASLLDAVKSLQNEIKGLRVAQDAPDSKAEASYPINKKKKQPADGEGVEA